MSDRFESYETILRNTLSESKTALTDKGVEVPEETKLRNVPALIGSIKTGSQVELVITAPDYEGQTLTATKGEKKATGAVNSGVARIPVDEEGTWIVSAEDGNSIELEVDMTIDGEMSGAKVYTIRIKKGEPDPTNRVEYQDDAIGMQPVSVSGTQVNYNGWDETFFFKMIYPVMLKTDGTVDYKLNPDNYSYKFGGISDPSEINDIHYDGNAMVRIEKMYTKFWSDSTYEYMSITNKPKDGYTAFGFIGESGDEVDCQYLGMFLGSNISNKLRSMSGQFALVKGDDSTYFPGKSFALNNGSNYGLGTYSIFQVLDMMFNIMFKTENCTKLGKGRSGVEEKEITSATPRPNKNMQTGLLNESGAIGVDTSTGCVKFMHIEDYFSNRSMPLAEQIEGLAIKDEGKSKGKIYIKTSKPYGTLSNNGNVTTSDYINETSFQTSTGNIKNSVLNNKYGRVPSVGGATTTTYECDQLYYDYWNNISSIKAGTRKGGIRGIASSVFEEDYTGGAGGMTGQGLSANLVARLQYEPQTA